MTKKPNFRAKFTPLQPTVNGAHSQVRYQEYLPDDRLSNMVYCYWHLYTITPLEAPFNYRVVADGCIDVLFDLGNPEEKFVAGLATDYNIFPLAQSFNYVGVRFMPAAFPLLFGQDASAITNRFEKLEVLDRKVKLLFDLPVTPESAIDEVIVQLNQVLLKRLIECNIELDGRVAEALNFILEYKGNLKLGEDMDLAISPRQLRRLFQFYIGESPKVFSKIVRFQSLLNTSSKLDIMQETRPYFDAGYYDQAHFIKEFRTFYGLPPGQATA